MSFFAERRRSERYDAIVVSPHMDDAVYSCGGRIAQLRRAGASVLVVTVYGNGKPPRAPEDTPPAPQGRFDDYTARLAEDQRAMAALDCDYVWLNLPELIFRKHSLADVARFALPFWPLPGGPAHAALAGALRPVLRDHCGPRGRVLFPLGLGGHPDHRLCFDAGQALARELGLHVSFYEDIPYAHVAALRTLRLDALGAPEAVPLWHGAAALGRFLFPQSALIRSAALLPLVGYLAGLLGLARLTRARRAREAHPPLARHAARIDDVVAAKVAAMRCYPSQTNFFFGTEDRIYAQLGPEGRYEEVCWEPKSA